MSAILFRLGPDVNLANWRSHDGRVPHREAFWGVTELFLFVANFILLGFLDPDLPPRSGTNPGGIEPSPTR
jgi:hypothetical protein